MRILKFFFIVLAGTGFNQVAMNAETLLSLENWQAFGFDTLVINSLTVLVIAAFNALILFHIGQLRNVSRTSFFILLTGVVYGSGVASSLIEAIFFGQALGFEITDLVTGALFQIPGIVLMGYAAATIPVADGENSSWQNQPLSILRMAMSIPAITVLYIITYFVAGFFIAMQFPAIVEFYGDDIPPVEIIALVQVFRGALWALMAYALMMIISAKKWHKAVIVGATFVIFHALPLLQSNEFMPWQVRMAHLLEVSLSIFIFGVLAGLIIAPRHLQADQERSSKQASP